MAKISMAQAAKMFSVSRPTLSKALKDGKITGEKTDAGWQLETSELIRVYPPRGDDVKPLHVNLSEQDGNKNTDLQAEIRVLQAELKAERQARELIERHLDDMRKLLPGPENIRDKPKRWWSW